MAFKQLAASLIAASLAGQAAAAVDPIVAKGQYLFYSTNGTQFFIKGVAYQQGIAPGGASETTSSTFIDSLADTAACQRDIPFLQQLGTNTIRVYAIDPTADHSVCMQALSDAGIYVIADLSSPSESINRDSPTWTTDLFARYQGVIDNLGVYPNTIGFFAGNEVTNNKTNSAASAFVKAAVRDSKAYITSKNFGRWLGVGYATNDDAETRDNLADYFNCGEDQSAAVDFWGYNIYEWCGESTFEASGYQERTEAFRNFSVPAFFSEYGCNNPGGGEARVWQETGVLYSDLMNTVWSGGMVYEYFQEQNDFGLVEQSGSSVTPLKDFQALADAISAVNANTSSTGITMDSYTPSNTPRACPAVDSTLWLASDLLPPTPNATACETMVASSACVPATTDAESMASLFGTICGLDAKACAGITSDPSTGTYGDFVMCNTTQQLTAALNQYYLNNGKSDSACDFKGQAKVVTPTLAVQSSDGSSKGSTSGSSVSSASASTSNSNSNSTSATSASSLGGSSASNSSSIVFNGRNSTHTHTNTTASLSPTKSSGSSAATKTPEAPLLTDPQDSNSNTNNDNDASAAAANALGSLASNATSANSTQSSGSGTASSGAATVVGSLGWAGSLLVAVGAGVALTL